MELRLSRKKNHLGSRLVYGTCQSIQNVCKLRKKLSRGNGSAICAMATRGNEMSTFSDYHFHYYLSSKNDICRIRFSLIKIC